MEDHTSRPRRWFERLLAHLDNWLSATDDDARAQAHGWTVARTPKSRVRTYRDPRWDTVSACLSCGGSGLGSTDGAGCPVCAGIGVVHPAPGNAVPVAGERRGARS